MVVGTVPRKRKSNKLRDRKVRKLKLTRTKKKVPRRTIKKPLADSAPFSNNG